MARLNRLGFSSLCLVICLYIGGFIGADIELTLAISYLCHAINNDTVFAAVVAHLQTHTGTWLDFDTLDFENPVPSSFKVYMTQR